MTLGESGSPILTEALAWGDCSVFHQLDLGDRMLFWADILASKISSKESPLREQAFLASATPEQLKQLKESMSREIASSDLLSKSWRKSLKY